MEGGNKRNFHDYKFVRLESNIFVFFWPFVLPINCFSDMYPHLLGRYYSGLKTLSDCAKFLSLSLSAFSFHLSGALLSHSLSLFICSFTFFASFLPKMQLQTKVIFVV